MAAFDSKPLILFSGLAADANVFVPQKLEFPQLVVPKWPVPKPEDTLATYCDRIADDLRSYGDVIIGGASFGGIVALHVAERLHPSAVILIGSVRSPGELSRSVMLFRPLKPLIPLIPIRFLQFCCLPITSKLAMLCLKRGLTLWRQAFFPHVCRLAGEGQTPFQTEPKRFFPHMCGLAKQFRNSDPTVFRWSLARILDWSSAPDVGCPIFQIHGDRDFVLPIRYARPNSVVAGGGHVISLTHPSEVNAFIRSVISLMIDKP